MTNERFAEYCRNVLSGTDPLASYGMAQFGLDLLDENAELHKNILLWINQFEKAQDFIVEKSKEIAALKDQNARLLQRLTTKKQ
jgi:hypothetical protein